MNSMRTDRMTWAGLAETLEGLVLLGLVVGLLIGCTEDEPLWASTLAPGGYDSANRPVHPISHTQDGRLRTGNGSAYGEETLRGGARHGAQGEPATGHNSVSLKQRRPRVSPSPRRRRARVNVARLRRENEDLRLLLAETRGRALLAEEQIRKIVNHTDCGILGFPRRKEGR